MKNITLVTCLWVAAGYLYLSIDLSAQSDSPFPPNASRRLNDQQIRGEGVFLQRCSLCHLPQAARLIPGSRPYGPSLTTLLRDASAQKEKAVREIISKGGPRMPGFQYGLTTADMDDLIAFLKSL